MTLIDAHAHTFENLKGFNGKGELRPIGKGKTRWATGEIVEMIPPELGETAFTYETLYSLYKKHGVEKAILLQGSFYGFQNEYAHEAALAHPDMFLESFTFDPFGIYADKIYARFTNEFNCKIIKFETSSGCGLMSYHTEYNLDEVFNPIADKASEHQQVLVLDIGSPHMTSFQPDKVRQIAINHPELKLVVCHLLAPRLNDEAVLLEGLRTLKLDNVFFDIAAIPANLKPEEYPYPTGARYIQKACDIVGSEHIMWGTDVPSVLCHDSFEHLLDYLQQSNLFSTLDLENMYYKVAKFVYL